MIDNDERRTVSALIWGDANVSEEIDITEATDRLIAYFRRTGVPEPSAEEEIDPQICKGCDEYGPAGAAG